MNIQSRGYDYVSSMCDNGITITVTPGSTKKSSSVNNKQRASVVKRADKFLERHKEVPTFIL